MARLFLCLAARGGRSYNPCMRNPRLDLLIDYPFRRLRELLDGVAPPPDLAPVVLSIGEPQHAPPPWVADVIAARAADWNRYPPLNGTPELRAAMVGALARRYGLPDGWLDADRHVLPLAGSREGLFQAALMAVPGCQTDPAPSVLLPNPFYQVYAGAAAMAGGEAVFLPSDPANGFRPDLDAADPATLRRCALMYLCSPSNPEGAAADAAYLARALDLARRHGFVLAVDECYADIYDHVPPPGALRAAADGGGGPDNLLVFHSLSKRSSAPGLRSALVAGDPALIAALGRLRAHAGATVPLPIQAASAALWDDAAHVADNRRRYRAKFDLAEEILGDRFGFRRPDGGFFLWLDVGDGAAATRRLWEKGGLRVLPGAYLARPDADGVNPGARLSASRSTASSCTRATRMKRAPGLTPSASGRAR